MSSLFELYDNQVVSDKVLFLYHGTGGNETDLLPLIEPLAATHRVIGLRGNVQQQGLNRFFIRNPDGTFDQESVLSEVSNLQLFLSTWCEENSVSPENILHVGYSNGANFILANLLLHPESVTTAALLHPMLPLIPPETLQLTKHHLFVSWSQNDEMMPAEKSRELLRVLEQAQANLSIFHSNNGHRITLEEVSSMHVFLKMLL